MGLFEENPWLLPPIILLVVVTYDAAKWGIHRALQAIAIGRIKLGPSLRRRFWFELATAISSIALLMITLVWNDWIEPMFGVDPDHHSGSLEWAVAVVAFAVAATFSITARYEWRRRLSFRAAGDTLA
jgi:hypothetical protein